MPILLNPLISSIYLWSVPHSLFSCKCAVGIRNAL